MKILEYNEFDPGKAGAQYKKLRKMLEKDDFRSAKVKKLAQGDFFRAELDYSNRLLFKLMRYGEERYALMLEVIENHAYDKSRFLRGAQIDEAKIPEPTAAELATDKLAALHYVNPARAHFNLLDKVISFDEVQAAIYHLPPPLIIIGSAGSGKTVLMLEKLKQLSGDVLYITHSPFLVENSRNLYYANSYQGEHQNLDFLSFREFLETIQVPEGREVTYQAFRGWFERYRKTGKLDDAHKLFEEFRGVLTGPVVESPWLSREHYLDLGIKQTIFLDEERPLVYDLFEKYLSWLKDSGFYDANILSQHYLALCQPRYDFVVVDEVQDITNIQLALILRSLRKAEHFALCGDSNQIVHPNFFSWANVKTLFYRSELADSKKVMHILHTNYRNSGEITALANKLLKIKQKRFGSIDRESNYLVSSLGGKTGHIEFLADKDNLLKELNQKTKQSTRFAVLVMRDEQKAAARRFFQTPLIFSVQEAKGLEYENILLYNFVSNDRANFNAIIEGVSAADLEGDLDYARARDKADKSLEVYKFFINSLYVAVTRAVSNLYLIENDARHGLLQLLGLNATREKVDLANQSSSLEDWQREARRLELQGKQEQADEIRKTILHTRQVPWEVLDQARFQTLLPQALDPKNVSNKIRSSLFEYAAFYDEQALAYRLAHAGFQQARHFEAQAPAIVKKYLSGYEGRHYKDVLRDVDAYGVDFRNRFNCTPLMLAARSGNLALIETLKERGANESLTDNFGRAALHWSLLRAYTDPAFAVGPFGSVYERLVPPSLSIKVGERLIKIDNHLSEFFLFHSLVALFKYKVSYPDGWMLRGFSTADFVAAVQAFPENIWRAERKKRAYLSSVLSRNEIDRDYAYNRRLFARMAHGHYVLNPLLAIKSGEAWINLYDFLNLPLLYEGVQGFNSPARYFLDRLIRLRERLLGHAPPDEDEEEEG